MVKLCSVKTTIILKKSGTDVSNLWPPFIINQLVQSLQFHVGEVVLCSQVIEMKRKSGLDHGDGSLPFHRWTND